MYASYMYDCLHAYVCVHVSCAVQVFLYAKTCINKYIEYNCVIKILKFALENKHISSYRLYIYR